MQVTVSIEGYKPATVTLEAAPDTIGKYLRPFFYSRFDQGMRDLPAESKVGSDILALCDGASAIVDSMGEPNERARVIDAVATQCRVWFHG